MVRKRLADRVMAVLDGADDPGLPPTLLLLPVYQRACYILGLPKAQWAEAIDWHQEPIRQMIRAECRRVYDLRKKIK